MKEKIKKLFGWFDVYRTEIILGVIFAVGSAILGAYDTAIVWIGFSFSWWVFKLSMSEENQRYESLKDLAKECNEKNAIQTTQWAYDELQLEMQRHRLTAIKLMIQKNKADFMQRKKSLSQYLKYSDAADGLYEQEAKRLHEMMDEIKRKNNDGKEQQSKDTETETTGA